jgi:hypothetical protein
MTGIQRTKTILFATHNKIQVVGDSVGVLCTVEMSKWVMLPCGGNSIF